MKNTHRVLSLVTATLLLGAAGSQAASEVPPAEALARLQAGNERFVAGKQENTTNTVQAREAVAAKQEPFAIILTCADSRTPPEAIFDQQLGSIFVVRVAGNVLNDEIIGSIEYAVEQFGTQLIVVLGHERCGAVEAARDTVVANGTAPGHIQSIVEAIRPAVEQTLGKDVKTTTEANVKNVSNSLRGSAPILEPKVKTDKLEVVAAYYDLSSGKATVITPPAK